MLRVTRDQKLTTAITGSYPRPLWYDVNLRGQSFKSALGDSMFREQYLDAPARVHGAVEDRAAPDRQARQVRHDLSDIMNAELRELSAAGCPLIQVEEPPHHGRTTRPDCTDAELEFLTEAFNRQLLGVDAEIWVHTCWGNPNQQRVYWETPSYERALPYLLALDADVVTFECASTDGRDLPLGIGVISHCHTVVEPAEHVARLIRRALEYIPPERLVVTTDCGFGREGLSRRIAYYKCVALVEGTNIVRRELGLPEARVRASDPHLYFASEA